MSFTSVIDLNLQKSVRYLTSLGPDLTVATQSFSVADQQTGFVIAEQAVTLVATGLKPGTLHRAYYNGVDVTQWCQQEGRQLGEGLVSNSVGESLFTPRPAGQIKFTFFLRPEIEATSPITQSASEASLLGSQRVLKLASLDNKSQAEVAFAIPAFARNEPTVNIRKIPNLDAPGMVRSVEVVPAATSTETYYTTTNYNLVQTFFADPEIVGGSGEVNLTSIELFFKSKPSRTNNASGNPSPGVRIAICEVENNDPILTKTINNSSAYRTYDQIFSYGDASTPVSFSFYEPLKLTTGKFYGIVVAFEDPGYELWVNKVGDKLVGTNTASPGSNLNKDGKLYIRNNSNVYTPLSDTDLKFSVRCASFISSSTSSQMVNGEYEFFTLQNYSRPFIGGEYVFQNTAPISGSLTVVGNSSTITGDGTDFTNLLQDETIVIRTSATSNGAFVTTVSRVVDSTTLIVSEPAPFSNTNAILLRTPTARVYQQDLAASKIILRDSTANTSVFTAANTIVGATSGVNAVITSVDDFSVDRVRIKGDVRVPSAGRVTAIVKASRQTDSGYVYEPNLPKEIELNGPLTSALSAYDVRIPSRSIEVNSTGLYTNASSFAYRKSFTVDLSLDAAGTGNYQTPTITGSYLTLFAQRNNQASSTLIPSVDSVGNEVQVDQEVLNNNGTASRHIGKRITFNKGRVAEDVRVFMTAYRPLGTDIQVYARIHNSTDDETFDDKVWTRLSYLTGENKFSSSEDDNDFFEYELGLPKYSDAANTLSIPFKSTFNDDALLVLDPTRLNPSSIVVAGDVVRVYDPLFPETNYIQSPVASSNATHIVLVSPITANNVVGSSVSVAKVLYPYAAYTNPENDNISRYFNRTSASFDGFDTMQIKIVFTGNTTFLAPKVDQVQVIGVSA